MNRRRPWALVVDDSEIYRYVAGRALAGGGFRVTTAGNASEALARLRTQPFDVVVIDEGLPDGTGVRLCRRIREFRGVSSPALVVLSAAATAGLERRARRSGADAVLEKAEDAQAVVAAVREAVARHPK